MALITDNLNELTDITNDYFELDDGKAWDVYFSDSYGLNYFLKQKKGLFEMVPGGPYFQVPLEVDEVASGFYQRGTTTVSRSGGLYGQASTSKTMAQQIIKNARFSPQHAIASAKILRVDGLANRGKYAIVKEVVARAKNAQKALTQTMSRSFHNDASTAADYEIFGTMECCANSDLGTSRSVDTGNAPYGNIAITTSTTGWTGSQTDKGAAPITLDMLRTMRLDAKIRDGKNGKIDLILMAPALFAVIQDILQAQQRFIEDKTAAEAGFTSIKLEGCTLIEDDYVNTHVTNNAIVGLNTHYYGFNVYEGALFEKTEWQKLENSPSDRYMDIYFDGNTVCSMRDAHSAYINVGT